MPTRRVGGTARRIFETIQPVGRFAVSSPLSPSSLFFFQSISGTVGGNNHPPRSFVRTAEPGTRPPGKSATDLLARSGYGDEFIIRFTFAK